MSDVLRSVPEFGEIFVLLAVLFSITIVVLASRRYRLSLQLKENREISARSGRENSAQLTNAAVTNAHLAWAKLTKAQISLNRLSDQLDRVDKYKLSAQEIEREAKHFFATAETVDLTDLSPSIVDSIEDANIVGAYEANQVRWMLGSLVAEVKKSNDFIESSKYAITSGRRAAAFEPEPELKASRYKLSAANSAKLSQFFDNVAMIKINSGK